MLVSDVFLSPCVSSSTCTPRLPLCSSLVTVEDPSSPETNLPAHLKAISPIQHLNPLLSVFVCSAPLVPWCVLVKVLLCRLSETLFVTTRLSLLLHAVDAYRSLY